MKKALIAAAALVAVVALSACGSLRTPTEGPRSKYVYYNTFFGISIESLVYGDGLVVSQK
ncbi:MAG: hypothetical protein J6Q65_04605 [Lentisphaeria bacterium]|nr:hypothetical protein [Lentisphaeria bacterium]